MSDRLKVAFETILTALLPSLAAYVRWEYRVLSVSPGPPVLISGRPVSTRCPFGTLASITLWPGPSGAYAVPVVGSLVLIEFHDGNPAKPAVCALDPNEVPSTITLGAGTDPVALSSKVDGELAKIAGCFATFSPGSGGASFPSPYTTPGPPPSPGPQPRQPTASTLPVVSQ